MEDRTFLVTGGAGFIGSHLVDHLMENGIKTTVIDDFNDYYDPDIKRSNIRKHLNNPLFTLIEGDIVDGNLIDRIFSEGKFQTAVHLAARAGVRPSIQDPMLYERVNGIGTLNILESCRKYSCQNLIFASSSSVYGTQSKVPFSEDDPIMFPISPYASTKRSNELICYTYHHLYGLNITCLRFFTVYGPRQRPEMAIHKFTRLIYEEKELPLFGDGESLRDYTYIDDILQGLVTSIEKHFPFEIINLGGSRTTSLKTLVKMIEAGLGKKARIKRLPDQMGDVPVTYADVSKAARLLNYKVTTPIDEGLEKFINWFVKTSGGKK